MKLHETFSLALTLLLACANDSASDEPTTAGGVGGKADSESVCCEPSDEPVTIEGAHCCDNGEWVPDPGNGDPSVCDKRGGLGEVCDVGPVPNNARGQEGDPCGSLINPLCDEGLFCGFPLEANCGVADHGGHCLVQPDGCPEYYGPVCGCDGQTYDNECFAHAAGVSATGDACEDPGMPQDSLCGGPPGFQCAAELFCDFQPANSCGEDLLFGVCNPVPPTCPDAIEPVCGCDGLAYDNACQAHAAGVTVDPNATC